MNANDDRVIVGEEPSADEMFFVAWGDDLIKDTLNVISQTNRQLLTISAALLAGTVAFFDKQILDKGMMICSMLGLFLSLLSAVMGVLPFSTDVMRRNPADISRAIKDGLLWKNYCLRFSAYPLVMSVFLLAIGVVARNL